MSMFNGNAQQPSYTIISTQVAGATVAPAASARPKVLTSFGQDNTAPVTVNTEQPIRTKAFVGSPAATRALTVAHLYREDAWGSDNYPAYHLRQAPSASLAAPTASQAAAQLNGFTAYSYAPAALSPSSDEFAVLSNPTKWAASLDGWKASMGLSSRAGAPQVPYEAPNQGIVTLLPANRPFVASLQTFCSQVLYGSTLVVGKNSVYGG